MRAISLTLGLLILGACAAEDEPMGEPEVPAAEGATEEQVACAEELDYLVVECMGLQPMACTTGEDEWAAFNECWRDAYLGTEGGRNVWNTCYTQDCGEPAADMCAAQWRECTGLDYAGQMD